MKKKENKYKTIKNRLQNIHGNKFSYYLFVRRNKPIKQYEMFLAINRNFNKKIFYEQILLDKIYKLKNNKLSIKTKKSKKITQKYFYMMKKRLRIKHSIDIYKILFE